MEFCEKCGGMILINYNKPICAGCGHRPKKKPKIKTSEKIDEKKVVAVIDQKEENINPIIDIKCGKCKNKKAYFWTLQTRASDESETKFYKCTKCEHTWRAYR